jgi:LysM repeat protein
VAAIAGAVVVGGPAAHAAVKAPVKAVTVSEETHTAAAVSHNRSYTVRAGDTLSSIAQRFYGNAADWRRIYQANMSVIQNPNVIYQGQVLRVPYGAPAATSSHTTPPSNTMLASHTSLSGTLSCHGLEELWDEAGGAPGEAFMAAEIAMAESSGQQFATGTVGERGYWQINPNHGSLSTYDPLGNAKAAIIISDDGTNWNPWTTFTSGAYRGRC